MAVWLTGAITESNVNIANNTSDVTVNLIINWNWGSWNHESPAPSGTITIDGTPYSFANNFNGNNTDTGSQVLATKTKTVTHTTDGSKTVACSASFASGVSSGTVYWNDSKTLETIPRASDVTLSNVSPNIGNAIAINIDRKVSTFKHYVYAKWAAKTIQIGTNVDTSVSWTLPMTLCEDIPNAVAGTGTVYVETYSGSTLIGIKTANFTGNVPSSVVPTISAVNVAEATAGLAAKFGAYVQNKSTLAVGVTAAGIYNSTIAKYETYIQSIKYTGASFTSNVITTSGTIGVAATVTDTRGRTASLTQQITVVAYSPPIINSMSAWRIDTTGTASDEGERIAMSMNFAISPVGNLNDRTYAFKYKGSGDASFTTFGSGTANWTYSDTQYFTTSPVISANNAYVIRLEIADYFQTITYDVEIPTAYNIIDFRNTGRGIAFGKVSELDRFEVDMDSDFTGNVRIYSASSTAEDSALLRFLRHDKSLLAFLATNTGGTGLKIHFYGADGIWKSYLAITEAGVVTLTQALPVASGGTGKKTVTAGSYMIGNGTSAVAEKTPAQVLTDIGAAAKPTLLWTNPNPNSGFSAQKVTLNLSGYDYVSILATFTNTVDDFSNMTTTKIGNKGVISITMTSPDSTVSAASFLNGAYRKFQTSTTGVTFENGQMIYAGNAYENWSGRAVPQEIFGIKLN